MQYADAFNNIEIFQPEFGVDLETVNITDLGNTKHTGCCNGDVANG